MKGKSIEACNGQLVAKHCNVPSKILKLYEIMLIVKTPNFFLISNGWKRAFSKSNNIQVWSLFEGQNAIKKKYWVFSVQDQIHYQFQNGQGSLETPK